MKTKQLIKIARLYFLEDMNQRDIAKKMNMSLAGVSRSISKAKEAGIVSISVQAPNAETSEMEIRLETAFSLQECLIVDSSPTAEVMYREMAEKLSSWFERSLSEDSRIGVSWGRTLKTIADNLPVHNSTCKAVVPIIGALGRIETGLFPNGIARNIAEKLDADAYLVNTPGVVDTPEIRNSLMTDSSFLPVESLWENLDVALFSVSEMGSGASVRDLQVLPADDLDAARSEGAETVANFLFFDSDGKIVPTTLGHRIVNIEYDALMRIPHRVVLAAGKPKHRSIRSALLGGLCHVLITDKETAEALL